MENFPDIHLFPKLERYIEAGKALVQMYFHHLPQEGYHSEHQGELTPEE